MSGRLGWVRDYLLDRGEAGGPELLLLLSSWYIRHVRFCARPDIESQSGAEHGREEEEAAFWKCRPPLPANAPQCILPEREEQIERRGRGGGRIYLNPDFLLST